MTPYKSKSNNRSGVIAYDIKENGISIQFQDGTKYLYTISSAGKPAIEVMINCALNNKGLSTYISQNNPEYAKKY